MLHRHCQNRQDRRYQRRNPNSIINNGNDPSPRRQTLIGSILAPLRQQKQKLLQPALPLPQPQQAYRQQQPQQQQQQYYNNQQPYGQQPYPYSYQQPPYSPTWRDQPQSRSQERDLPAGQEGEYHPQDYDNNNNSYYYDNDDRRREDSPSARQLADYSPTHQTTGITRGSLDPQPGSSSLLSQRKEEESERDRRR